MDRHRFAARWIAPVLLAAMAMLPGCGASGGAQACASGANVGFRVIEYAPGLRAALWYPSTAPAARASYPGAVGVAGDVAKDAPLGSCGRAPLVVFSHGDGGCGTQSIFLTEELARRGYVVAAPDHADALCSVDGGPNRGPSHGGEPPFTEPDRYTDATYRGRRDDVEALVAFLLGEGSYRGAIDTSRIAIAGHSLGGYTGAGLGGGWESWRDGRFRAALLLSPYVQPYLVQERLQAISIPLMYQGGTLDLGITPFLVGANGAYAKASPPKVLVSFAGAGHFDWTNTTCARFPYVRDCLASVPNAARIVDYGAAFLDRYLRGVDAPLLESGGDGLAVFESDLGG